MVQILTGKVTEKLKKIKKRAFGGAKPLKALVFSLTGVYTRLAESPFLRLKFNALSMRYFMDVLKDL